MSIQGTVDQMAIRTPTQGFEPVKTNSNRFSKNICCQCVQKIFAAFLNALERLLKHFKACYSKYFGPLTSRNSVITSADAAPTTTFGREHRIRSGAENIQGRLKREFRYAQNQMANEPDKDFAYREAPAQQAPEGQAPVVPPALEERIGNYPVGISHFQGERQAMEDEHLTAHFNLTIAGNVYPLSLFGIFDGHGGTKAAEYVRDHLQEVLNDALIEFNPNGLSDVGIWNALKITCVRLSDRFLLEYHSQKVPAEDRRSIATEHGTTATFSMILDGKLWTANVGDSRAILSNSGVPISLSEDAKPLDPRYKRGIEKRGGEVQFHGLWRINADLSCARAIGDFRLHGANSARPKITMMPLSSIHPGSDLLIACDGNFDVASTKQIIQAVHAHRDTAPGVLARNLVHSAHASGSRDNISMLVIRIT
jgi:protein phosphatase 1L